MIQIHDHIFKLSISEKEIAEMVTRIAKQIDDYNIQNPLIVSVLQGSFMFTSDICKQLTSTPELHFIKVTSYTNMESSGTITELIGFNGDVKDKTIFIIEDIIDSGRTIDKLYNDFLQKGAKEVVIVTLLLKPDACKTTIPITIVGKQIPNDFVIGYGMDYNGLGRSLKEIYVLNN